MNNARKRQISNETEKVLIQNLYRVDSNQFLTQMASEVLDELDALPVLLLPELQMTVDARCHDEVRPESIIFHRLNFSNEL